MLEDQPKPKYNTLKLLSYFQTKFFNTYAVAFSFNPGRDIKLMKRVKELFEQNEQLGDLMGFLDLCFKENPTNQISTAYLLAVVNRKLGVRKSTEKVTPKTPQVDSSVPEDWSDASQMWDDKLS